LADCSALKLKKDLSRLSINTPPERIIITLENIQLNEFGLHDPNYVLVLSQEAVD